MPHFHILTNVLKIIIPEPIIVDDENLVDIVFWSTVGQIKLLTGLKEVAWFDSGILLNDNSSVSWYTCEDERCQIPSELKVKLELLA